MTDQADAAAVDMLSSVLGVVNMGDSARLERTVRQLAYAAPLGPKLLLQLGRNETDPVSVVALGSLNRRVRAGWMSNEEYAEMVVALNRAWLMLLSALVAEGALSMGNAELEYSTYTGLRSKGSIARQRIQQSAIILDRAMAKYGDFLFENMNDLRVPDSLRHEALIMSSGIFQGLSYNRIALLSTGVSAGDSARGWRIQVDSLLRGEGAGQLSLNLNALCLRSGQNTLGPFTKLFDLGPIGTPPPPPDSLIYYVVRHCEVRWPK